jgi:uncharacterized protein YjbI with pentapeptide repeats
MVDQQALELLQEERFDRFNAYAERKDGYVDLSNAHLRGYDLRKCFLTRANLSGAYLRGADLRGLDLQEATLDGASMMECKASGTLFPRNLDAQEIIMSLRYGTRLRQNL